MVNKDNYFCSKCKKEHSVYLDIGVKHKKFDTTSDIIITGDRTWE